MWSHARGMAAGFSDSLPQRGERVAFVGCGTSWFVSMVAAARREELGLGESDAFTASEFPLGRQYDRVVAISRSGTTTEVHDLLQSLQGVKTIAIIAVDDSPIARHDAAEDPAEGREGARLTRVSRRSVDQSFDVTDRSRPYSTGKSPDLDASRLRNRPIARNSSSDIVTVIAANPITTQPLIG